MILHEIRKTVEEILEIRVIKELITEIREDLQDRRKYRRDCLSKLDDLISCLNALLAQDRNSK